MLRIINLSHNDLDGIASAIAIRTAHPNDHVKTQFVPLAGINNALKRACESKVPWDRIILSDISIKVPTNKTVYKNEDEKELVLRLPELIRSYVDNGGEFVVIDHHETAIPMKFFLNAELHPDSIIQINDDEGNPVAGSELAAMYMVSKLNEMDDTIITAEVTPVMNEDGDDVEFQVVEYDLLTLAEHVEEFCRIAGDLDVWRDPFGFGGKLALALELMEDEYGAMEDFFGLITTAISKQCSFEEALSEIPIVDYYYHMASNRLYGTMSLADRSLVELAPLLHQIEAKFFSSHGAKHIYDKTNGIVLITYPNNPGRVSLRRHEAINVNLGKFCKMFGGGGHSASAGLEIPEGMGLEDIIEGMKTYMKETLDKNHFSV